MRFRMPLMVWLILAASVGAQSSPRMILLCDSNAVAGDDHVVPDASDSFGLTLDLLVGNSQESNRPFGLDRTCQMDSVYVALVGQDTSEPNLMTSWEWVQMRAITGDSNEDIDSVVFDFCLDANRDGQLDLFPFWQTARILSADSDNVDRTYPFSVSWHIHNLLWNPLGDSLGLPPADPEFCTSTFFVRARAFDAFGHTCGDTHKVTVTDDEAPLARILWPPEWGQMPCFHPHTGMDSVIALCAHDTMADTPLWLDLAYGVFQYKVLEAPDSAWVIIDTITSRSPADSSFHSLWNISGLDRGLYLLRFLAFDLCGNHDALATPVAAFQVECDTIPPLAIIVRPDSGFRVTDSLCSGGALPSLVARVPYNSQVDSVAFFMIDTMSVPGLTQYIFVGWDTSPDSMLPDTSLFFSANFWDTRNLLSGFYGLYAVVYGGAGNPDPNPPQTWVFVDNTPPETDSCWISDPDIPDKTQSIATTFEDSVFVLRAKAGDVQAGVFYRDRIRWIQFQVLNRFGAWEDLASHTDYNPLYGADVSVGTAPFNGISRDDMPDSNAIFEVFVRFSDIGSTPLDSIRFRCYAADDPDIGDPRVEGDRNRDCQIDRDAELCSRAIEIRSLLPSVDSLVISLSGGNAVLHWSSIGADTYLIFGTGFSDSAGVVLDTVIGQTYWTDTETPIRPARYFYYVTAIESRAASRRVYPPRQIR